MSFFERIFKRSNAATPQEPLGMPLNFGKITGKMGAMSLSAVNNAVNIIANSVAVLPVKVSDVSGNCSDDDLRLHPVSVFFSARNTRSHISKFHLLRKMMCDVMLKGNAFALIERDEQGRFYRLRYLPSVTIMYNQSTDELVYQTPKKVLAPEDVVHFRLYTDDGIRGLSVISFGARTFDLSENAENLASKTFENGCNLSGVLKVNGTVSKEQRAAILNSWASAYSQGGSGLAVIQGNMEYQAIQQSSSESQLLETRGYNVLDIARFFNINAAFLGDPASNSQSLESRLSQLVTITLQPYIRMIEEELSRKLLDSAEINFEVNLDETYLLKADKTALASYFSTMLSTGVLCINEVRKTLGLQPIEGGDKHIIAYTDISQNTISNNKEEEQKDEILSEK